MGGGSQSSFVEVSVPQQKVIDGIAFPKILQPAAGCGDEGEEITRAVESVKQNRAWLEEQLHLHDAIMFRGFGLRSATDFEAFVEAFGWEELEYTGLARRTQLLKRVYTANEAPPEAEIFFHHEMCQSGTFPTKLFFFCEIEPKEGGETPILSSHKLTERMELEFPDFVHSLEELGLRYVVCLNSAEDSPSSIRTSWQTLYKTTNREEAERRAPQMGARLEWLPDKKVKVIQDNYKATRVIDERGRKAWFNNIVFNYKAGLENPDKSIPTFGDGSPLPTEAVAACARIQEEEAVAIPWRQGDVLLLSNIAVMHGRRPCKPPRTVLVALCK
eukprot:c26977_g1_i1 orf=139-1128(+)